MKRKQRPEPEYKVRLFVPWWGVCRTFKPGDLVQPKLRPIGMPGSALALRIVREQRVSRYRLPGWIVADYAGLESWVGDDDITMLSPVEWEEYQDACEREHAEVPG